VNPATLSLVLAVASAWTAVAQRPPAEKQEFSADRPGFATPPNVLPRGTAQVEGGVSFAVDKEGGIRQRTLTFGNPLIRIGVGGGAELRIGEDGLLLARTNGIVSHESTAGWSDISVGAKIAVVNEGRLLPAVSLLPSISVPSGHMAYTSSTYDPSLAVAWLKTLPGGASLGGTFTGMMVSGEQARLVRYTSATSVQVPAPKSWAGFAEVYAVSPAGAGNGTTWISDAGVSRNFGSNLQIDIEAGRRLSRGAPCWFFAAGFALRHASLFGH
jgi:hypothetical protein